MSNIHIINRKNEKVKLDLNKILNRLTELINMEPKLSISADFITLQTVTGIVDNITTYELDELSSKICGTKITDHPDYGKLGSRIEISNLHKETSDDFVHMLYIANSYTDKTNKKIQLINNKLIKFAEYYKDEINNSINYKKDYNLNYFGLLTLKKAYLLKHINKKRNIILERPQHLYMRIALGIHLCYINDNGQLKNPYTINDVIQTYNLLSDGLYSHATPTLYNAGTCHAALSSCFLLNISDDLDNIYKTLWDTAKISKWSGGIGICVTDIRGKGSIIKGTNGISDGIIPMLKLFNDSANYISQGGGKRKGSTAVYIEPWHIDIESFLNLKKPIGDEMLRARDLFLALWIPDIFMERLIKAIETEEIVLWSLFCPSICPLLKSTYGNDFSYYYIEYEKQKKYNKQINIISLWRLILEIQQESGVPYIMYKDHINRKCNQNNLGIIKSSNLCVKGDTLILTNKGYKKIKDLAGIYVNIWNGKEFSKSLVAQTGENQELLKITTNDGCQLECTKYHKFKIVSYTCNNKYIEIEAYKLKKGMKLIKCNYPTIDGNKKNDIKYPYIYGEKKVNIPHTNSSLQCKLNWFAGLADANGYICKIEGYKCIQITSIHKEFLYKVKLLCNTLGTNPKITLHKKNEQILMPTKDNCKHIWKLLFNVTDTYYLYNDLQLPTKRLIFDGTKPNRNVCKFVKIHSIEKVEGLYNTYCFNEPKEHQGIFNGIITGNCAEINIYTDKNNIGVCNLASITLPKYVKMNKNEPYFDYDQLYDVVKIVTFNLNKVIDNNYYAVIEGEYSDKQNRPIGIGVSGLADVFILFKCSYTSDLAKDLNKKIFETIYYASLTASNELAKIYGPYHNFKTSMLSKGILQPDLWGVTPSFDKWDWNKLKENIINYGSYNSLNIALMPTASTASILGTSENFEPITSNMYTRNVLSGTFQIVNQYLIQDLINLGIWNNTLKQKIIINQGSIQGLNEIPTYIQDIYKTIWEYRMIDLLEMDKDRSVYVCQSSSSNRFIEYPTINKLTSMHIKAWNLGLKTSSYYIRTKTIAKPVQFNVNVDIMQDMKKEKQCVLNNNTNEECLICTV